MGCLSTQGTMHTILHTYAPWCSQFTYWHVFGLWEETHMDAVVFLTPVFHPHGVCSVALITDLILELKFSCRCNLNYSLILNISDCKSEFPTYFPHVNRPTREKKILTCCSNNIKIIWCLLVNLITHQFFFASVHSEWARSNKTRKQICCWSIDAVLQGCFLATYRDFFHIRLSYCIKCSSNSRIKKKNFGLTLTWELSLI